MIAHLRGTLIERNLAGAVVDCAGVGYEVIASTHTLATLPEIGSPLSLRIYTHYQEHRITLFAFSSADERDLFDLLITVKNVGPSSAIKILSAGAGPIAIAQLIAAKETKSLTAIKGIGKKTSEMLVVELNEKCEALLMTWGASGLVDAGASAASKAKKSSADSNRSQLHNDVISALVQLGFRQPEAEKVVDLLPDDPGASLESVMRQALQAMPR